MTDLNPRAELAQIAASLRAYLEWQVDTGAAGIPRRPKAERDAREATPRASVESAVAPEAVAADAAPTPRPFTSEDVIPAPPPRNVATTAAIPSPARTAPSTVAPVPVAAKPTRPLDVIGAEVASCTKCGLHTTRTNTVFARGNPAARLCFVGEGPGADEDAQGLPFVGRAGQLLDKMIRAMGLDPANDVYVCNIVKCRPPGNRRPEPDEITTCIPYLHEQLANVAPRVIVALGNTAVAGLLGTTIGITKVRGNWKLYRGKIAVMPTYHPSYLLRPSAEQAEAKRQVWEDLQAVMKELGLPSPPRA